MKRMLAIAVSLALLVWLAASGRWHGLAEVVARVPVPALLLALAGFAISYLLRGLRIYDEFRAVAAGRFGACLRLVLVHNAFVNVLPFRGGEAAFPMLLQRNFGVALPRAVASLFWLRLQDAFVVMALAALLVPGLPALLRIAGVAGVLGVAWWLPRWARAPHNWAEGGKITAKLAKLRDAFADTTGHARYGWLWTVSNWTVKLAAQAWLLASLLPAEFQTGAAGALGAELAAILPVQGVAGFGTYEAGAAAAMLPTGIALQSGLQAALALHLFVIAYAVSAGAIAWLVPVASHVAPPHKNQNSDSESTSS